VVIPGVEYHSAWTVASETLLVCLIIYYLRQGGYVFIGVSLLVSRIKQTTYSTDFHKIRGKGGTRATEEILRFVVVIRITLR